MSRGRTPPLDDGGDRTIREHPIAFQPTEGGDLEIVDLPQRHRITISTGEAVAPTVGTPGEFLFPVDAAVAVTTDRLRFSQSPAIYVRDAEGALLGCPSPVSEEEFPAGEYYLEIESPIKLYLRLEGPMTVTATMDHRTVELDGSRRVDVGARSRHEQPAGTVTTTSEPADVMAAISTFGSALKTTSPERSFPTLRGHPPEIELGDELSIPDELTPPDTGVTVEVPPEYRYVYPVAPLAYYLCARVVPGNEPRLVTDAGFTYDLTPGTGFERAAERVLKKTFLLDCVTRTEGLYDVDLHERRSIEPDVDLDFAALYDCPLAERLEAYLPVRYEVLESSVPDWKLTTYVETSPTAVEALPFVVADLAVVRTEDSIRAGGAPPGSEAGSREQETALDGFLRSAGSASVGRTPTSITVDSTRSMENAWIGDGAPRGASKATAEAYRNRFGRSLTPGDIDVTVVCNEPEMLDERDVVGDIYGTRGDTGFDAERRERLTVDELRAVLATDASFVHYIGHVDGGGFRCPDGTLDVTTLDDVGVELFLLNACASYEQGMALIDAGAVGGIVTLAEVVNESAIRVGSTVARLLNNGYPLRPALEIARHDSYVADDYIVVGDGGDRLAKTDTTMLELFRVRREGDAYVLEFRSYADANAGMGTMQSPNVDGNDRYYLSPGLLEEFQMADADELLAVLHRPKDIPVLIDGSLHWSNEVEKGDLPRRTLQ